MTDTQFAVSVFKIKTATIDDEQRIVEGYATTPATDRVGDVVEPRGGVFVLPLPLLMNHKSEEPVGQVIAAHVQDGGIRITAQIGRAKSSALRERLDAAWESVKTGLVRGFSVGFRPLETTPIRGTGGTRHVLWEWLELSLVALPANAEATIQAIKSVDQRLRNAGVTTSCEPPRRRAARRRGTRAPASRTDDGRLDPVRLARAKRASRTRKPVRRGGCRASRICALFISQARAVPSRTRQRSRICRD